MSRLDAFDDEVLAPENDLHQPEDRFIVFDHESAIGAATLDLHEVIGSKMWTVRPSPATEDAVRRAGHIDRGGRAERKRTYSLRTSARIRDSMIDLRSDNTLGCSPEILAALHDASRGEASSYGADPWTDELRARCAELFEHDVSIFPLATGTGANALALAAFAKPWGGIFCHTDAHIHRDEMGAPEFYTGGAKLVAIEGRDGKIGAAALDAAIDEFGSSGRMLVPAALSLTNATEAGTVYTRDELLELTELAHRHSMKVHVDGARFANAIISTGGSPAELSWKAGVDALVLGATKNGAMAAELLVVFDDTLAAELTTRVHRAGQRFSKMRFLSAQLLAYLKDGLWLRNAQHANLTARSLAEQLTVRGIEIVQPVEANIVFARFEPAVRERLAAAGALFYDWPLFGENVVRLVCGFDANPHRIAEFAALTGPVRK